MNETYPYKAIQRQDRVRQDYKNIDELVESILRFGLIQPIVVDFARDATLVAGGSRMLALDAILAKPALDETTTHPSIVELFKTQQLTVGVHVVDKPTASIAELTEMELEENIRRHALDWREECIGIAKVHRIRAKQALDSGNNWAQKQTAQLLGVSRAKITYILLIAQELQNLKSPVQKATSVTEALQLLTKKKADDVAAALAKQSVRNMPSREVKLDETLVLPGQATEPLPDDFFSTVPRVELDDEGARAEPFVQEDTLLVDVNQIVYHMSIEKALTVWGTECCDGIITDWPYGIDMANLEGIVDTDRVVAEHDAIENQENFESWLAIMFQLLRPDSYCVIFNDPEHHSKVWEAAVRVGFKYQRWPLIWIKTHTCRNGAAQYNFTKNFEEAIVLRKGNATLQASQASSFWMGSNIEVKKQLHGHPFVKPYELWQWIATAVVREGGTIVEPFSGVGSGTISLLARGYHVKACEVNETHFNHQIANVEKFYHTVTKGRVEFI